jgi:hypothetical protein
MLIHPEPLGNKWNIKYIDVKTCVNCKDHALTSIQRRSPTLYQEGQSCLNTHITSFTH